MPYTAVIIVMLLLAAIVAFMYFYVKRAQARDSGPVPARDRQERATTEQAEDVSRPRS
jgi:flagellar basal body-associated protein FliL